MTRVFELPELRNRVGVFKDRRHAGRVLATAMLELGVKLDYVLGVVAGGIPVAVEVARAMGVDVKAAVVSKVLFPWTTEAGFGAVSWTEEVEIDWIMARSAGLTDADIGECIKRAREKVRRRTELFRDLLPESLEDAVVAVVDDGVATGYTMLVAIKTARRLGARTVIAAAPTAHLGAVRLLLNACDAVVVPNVRSHAPYAVADAYALWRDVDVSEALSVLKEIANLSSEDNS